MDAIYEIKSRLNIHDVVAQFVQLQKAGRNFKGLCPFHQEKTPSFIVSPDKGLAYCFGCHRGGDIFKFTMEREGISFGESLKLLAEKAGVKLPREYKMPEKGKRERFLAMHLDAADFFEKNLWETDDGKAVQKYLTKKRKFEEKTVKDFGLGYAPDDEFALTRALLKKDFTREEIIEAGLAVSGVNSFHDRFRQRLMFPIWDSQGRIVAFGGRALKEGQEPKYLNSPETMLYSKSNILYAYDRAKEAIRKEDRVMVMEGYMDVLRSHERGFMNAVASCGTALTKQQVEIVKRQTLNIILFFDSDEAGRQALLRSWPIATAEGMNIFVLRAKGAKDPDEWLRDDISSVKDALKNPINFFEFLMDDVKKRFDLNNVQDKKAALAEILPLLAQVGNKIELDTYLQNLSQILKTTPQRIYEEMYIYGRTPREIRKTYEQKTTKMKLSEYLIACLLQYPFTFGSLPEIGLTLADFEGDENSLYKIIESVYNNKALGEEMPPIVEEKIPEAFREKVKIWSLFAETQNQNLTPAELKQEVKAAAKKLWELKREERKRGLYYELKEAEEQHDEKRRERLLQDYQDLIRAA